MTETKPRYVAYGDKRFSMTDDMTLDQAKSIMARHFPELSEPQIETREEDNATVFVFTKKAGRKGARAGARAGAGPVQVAIRRLLRAKPAPVPDALADVALAIFCGRFASSGADYGAPSGDGFARAADALQDTHFSAQWAEAERVEAIRRALLDAPSAMPAEGAILL